MDFKDINSKDNPIFKLIKTLNKKKGRDENGLFLIEGIRLLEEAINHGVKLHYLVINENTNLLPKENLDCQVLRISNNLFKDLSDTVTPQGIIGVARQPNPSLKELTLLPNPLIVVLNGIQDPGNLGTIIRTSAAAKAAAVLLTEGTVDLYNPKVIRATMGAVFQIPIIHGLGDEEAINWLNSNNINILVADINAEQYYFSVNLKGATALVIGNENKGPSPKWKSAANNRIKIPILGDTESLNASIAAGILIYDAIRQRHNEI
ncbi:TrmH family RNA methyltransferase [Desulfitibacter alkalitolerans]|uniref:TrmH family RNA methyltransferase n=1 Tax=Desulfitibacter alkalitolerans TaxID=264641 RepID=UPI000685B07F|nr:RNA methyltransferase [Desulfitibacter alkalitolerans]